MIEGGKVKTKKEVSRQEDHKTEGKNGGRKIFRSLQKSETGKIRKYM